ncbi:MAG: hypothetical protein IJK31_09335, partial [Ruminococcus sp.]|nr:hypothetical protein [Ruminococcus sp.]
YYSPSRTGGLVTLKRQQKISEGLSLGDTIHINCSLRNVDKTPFLKLSVLGREFEGEPFFKRVSLNNCRKHSV